MLVLALLAYLGVTSGLGSGPYLPRGWRPDGPAFLLPAEIKSSSENPLKDLILQGQETDSFREYGPPDIQDVSQDISVQKLPNPATYQPFLAVKEFARSGRKETFVEATTVIENSEITTALPEDESTYTAGANAEVTGTRTTVTEAMSTTEVNLPAVSEEEITGRSSDTLIEKEIKTDVTSIADILKGSVEENHVIKVKEQTNQVQDYSTDQVPEGFLEYGPPGFREYGPPLEPKTSREFQNKTVDIITTVASPSVKTIQDPATNRKRRFSPKLRISSST